MKNFKELLSKLNELSIIQKSGDWSEDLPIDIWNDYFKGNFKEVKHNLDIDTHRWYETSTVVIKIYDRLLGINYITNVFSESTEREDCYHTISFFEMKEVTEISYKEL